MSGASTLRNAVKRVTHKERAQPSDRKRFGLLEKHKDYIVRARDFQKKQSYLTTLRKKADERNPDEFYHHMHNSQVHKGKHVEKSKSALDKDTVDLLKTQDMGYLVYKKSVDDKKISRLRENIHLIGDFAPKKHTLFVDEDEDLECFDVAKHLDTAPELINRSYNRPTNAQLQSLSETNIAALEATAQRSISGEKRHKSAELSELRQRTSRSKKLARAVEALHMQRNVSKSKGTKKKITLTKLVGKSEKEKEVVVYKWKRQRTK